MYLFTSSNNIQLLPQVSFTLEVGALEGICVDNSLLESGLKKYKERSTHIVHIGVRYGKDKFG